MSIKLQVNHTFANQSIHANSSELTFGQQQVGAGLSLPAELVARSTRQHFRTLLALEQIQLGQLDLLRLQLLELASDDELWLI